MKQTNKQKKNDLAQAVQRLQNTQKASWMSGQTQPLAQNESTRTVVIYQGAGPHYGASAKLPERL